MASASKADVLICDEVTSGLGVFAQAVTIELLVDLQKELGLAMLFVTHNLPLVRSASQHLLADTSSVPDFGETLDRSFAGPQ